MIALAMLAGVFILAIGILVGRLLAALRPALPKQPKPVCGCTHHYSVHDPKGDMRCNVAIYVGSTYRGKCACLRYSGPVPLPEYFATEIAREAGE